VVLSVGAEMSAHARCLELILKPGNILCSNTTNKIHIYAEVS
jgi:hypothetical protein